MTNQPYIKGARQARVIRALLNSAVSVKEMGPKTGALNPRQIILELRRQGFKGIIQTRRYTVIDQDGKRCRPGEYYIPHSAKPMVEKALTGYAVQVNARLIKSTKKPHNSNHSGRV